MKNKCFINYCGLLGILSFISYTCAVIFSPLAYPGYDWMSQAVSDLSASNAPSLGLWNQLSAIYNSTTLVSIMMVCLGIKNRYNKTLRIGIYFFAIMEWISAIGYGMFPLSDSGFNGEFSDIMHMIVTVLVVGFSILSLVLIIISGIRDKNTRSYGIMASIALLMMFTGAIGTNIIPKDYFGIVERFSVFAAVGFNAFLGYKLFILKIDND